MAKSIDCNSVEASNLNIQQSRLNKINEIKDYFIAEIKERKVMDKRLSKYIASFDYLDKSLIVLSAASGSNKWYFYCIICNRYWYTSRNSKCKF